MKFPIEVQQFAARLTNEDLTLVNELIPELLPDRDLSDNTITGREIMMAMAETASLKLRKIGQSKPEDLARIKQLESELELSIKDFDTADKNYSQILSENVAEIDNLKMCKSELETRIQELETELSGISTEHTQVKEKALKLEKFAPVPNEMRLVAEPLTSAMLQLYAEKIRLRYKIEVTPGEILISLFVRYVTKRETELPGFPFLISKNEIVELAKQIDNE